jgi:hypothetical protein
MKNLINTLGSDVFISDTGINILASSTYLIPPQDYLRWAASSDVIVKVGDGTLVVNDGTSNLSISDGVALIKGIFPSIVGLYGAGQTRIGNVTDRLKVIDQDSLAALLDIAAGLGVTTAAIVRQAEQPITGRAEVDLTGVSYTVPNGKKFLLTAFVGSYDAQATIHLRLKKQVNSAGAWTTLFRITLEVGGQGQSSIPYNFGNGIYVGAQNDSFKVTVEASLRKGTIWSAFAGAEI